MSLKIVHDDTPDWEVQELCCLCRTPTRWWYGTGPDNVAVCPDCAKTATHKDLPTKEQWFKKERALSGKEAA